MNPKQWSGVGNPPLQSSVNWHLKQKESKLLAKSSSFTWKSLKSHEIFIELPITSLLKKNMTCLSDVYHQKNTLLIGCMARIPTSPQHLPTPAGKRPLPILLTTDATQFNLRWHLMQLIFTSWHWLTSKPKMSPEKKRKETNNRVDIYLDRNIQNLNYPWLFGPSKSTWPLSFVFRCLKCSILSILNLIAGQLRTTFFWVS